VFAGMAVTPDGRDVLYSSNERPLNATELFRAPRERRSAPDQY
jgi:hypothetical protein